MNRSCGHTPDSKACRRQRREQSASGKGLRRWREGKDSDAKNGASYRVRLKGIVTGSLGGGVCSTIAVLLRDHHGHALRTESRAGACGRQCRRTLRRLFRAAGMLLTRHVGRRHDQHRRHKARMNAWAAIMIVHAGRMLDRLLRHRRRGLRQRCKSYGYAPPRKRCEYNTGDESLLHQSATA
jgi:hypothetical protein